MLTKEEIGIRFKHIRARTGMTQKVFGQEVGLTEYSVLQVEKGNMVPTIHVVSAIEVLGYNRDFFFDTFATPIK